MDDAYSTFRCPWCGGTGNEPDNEPVAQKKRPAPKPKKKAPAREPERWDEI